MNRIFKQAFTLIELLVVIAVIGILSGFVAVSMKSSVNSANDTKRKAGIDTIRKALTYYGVLNGGTYPSLSRCTVGGTCSFPATFLELLPNIPTDPVSGNYSYSSNGTTFNVSATLSNSTYYNYSSLDGFTSVDNTFSVANWPMHEGAGSTIYDKAGTNTGTINGANWSSNRLSFDGNDYVDFGNGTNLSFGAGDFSVEAWIYYTGGTPVNVVIGLLAKSADMNSTPGYWMGFTTYGGSGTNLKLLSSITNGAWGTGSLECGAFFLPNTWQHYVITRSGSSFKNYLNGNIDCSRNDINANINNATSQTVGKAGLQYFVGRIDDVRMYNRALTPSEVTASYNAKKANH
jgi:prepilin-type N-terminal cleavage/methylation domain-containing protein